MWWMKGEKRRKRGGGGGGWRRCMRCICRCTRRGRKGVLLDKIEYSGPHLLMTNSSYCSHSNIYPYFIEGPSQTPFSPPQSYSHSIRSWIAPPNHLSSSPSPSPPPLSTASLLTTLPPSNLTTHSAPSTASTRCAITTTVLPFNTLLRVPST